MLKTGPMQGVSGPKTIKLGLCKLVLYVKNWCSPGRPKHVIIRAFVDLSFPGTGLVRTVDV